VIPSQQRPGFLLELVKPVGNSGHIGGWQTLGYSLGLKSLVHLDERPKIIPSIRANFQFSTFVGLNRN
jgi:hypothetical protein